MEYVGNNITMYNRENLAYTSVLIFVCIASDPWSWGEQEKS